MSGWIARHRWPIAIVLILMAVLLITVVASAQPPVPHAVMPGDDCLGCHQSGVGGAPRVAWDHLGRSNEDCDRCHQISGAPAAEIPHTLVGREDCFSCHREGIGTTPALGGSHVYYSNEDCQECHVLSPQATEPPEPTPVPTPGPSTGPVSMDGSTCISCHQVIFADEEHALFTGQPTGNAQTGEALFEQLCVSCHGDDGTTPVGPDETMINSEAYWSTHDDSAILQDIGIGSHGQMTAFVQDYGGPLTWEEVLDITAYVRTWGPFATPPAEPPAGGRVSYVETIGPLLTERCGSCHGGTSGLTVTEYASLMAGADSGPVVVPGAPEESRIVEVQRSGHYAQLSESELDRLIEWIAAGAPEE
ncbi:MAG: c-type cytochrome [Anaerolineae bacterium]|jgi:mono/diheme cytochrome c family protein